MAQKLPQDLKMNIFTLIAKNSDIAQDFMKMIKECKNKRDKFDKVIHSIKQWHAKANATFPSEHNAIDDHAAWDVISAYWNDLVQRQYVDPCYLIIVYDISIIYGIKNDN